MSCTAAISTSAILLHRIEQRRDPILWRKIAARTKDVADTFTPPDLANIVFSFAKLRLRDKQMLDKLAQEGCILLPQMQTNDVCKFLSSFAQLDVKKPLLLKLAVREVAKRGHELDVTQLAEFLHVFSKFEVTKPTIKLLAVLRNNIASKQWSIEECQKLPLLSTRSTTGKHAPFSYTKGATTIAGGNMLCKTIVLV